MQLCHKAIAMKTNRIDCVRGGEPMPPETMLFLADSSHIYYPLSALLAYEKLIMPT